MSKINSVDRSKSDAMPPARQKLILPYAQSTEVPAGAIMVNTYKEYLNLVKKWVSGKLDDTLVIIGAAGIGKTEQALRTMRNQGHAYIKGQATRYGVYLKLLEHIDEPVILDDIDSLLNNREVTGLLKMLLETRSPRTIHWVTGNTLDPNKGIPSSFPTKSRTMILANELRQVSKNFGAVLDRSTVIWFAPTPAEIHKYAGTWFKDKEVYGYVGARIHATPSPSCRYYYHGLKWKQASLPWKKMIHDIMLPAADKAMLIRELEGRYPTAKERVDAWKRETGESEQAYYATKKAVGIQRGEVTKRSRAVGVGMKQYHARLRLARELEAVADADERARQWIERTGLPAVELDRFQTAARKRANRSAPLVP